MQENQENFLVPGHPAPVDRLRLEVVDLKSRGIEGCAAGTVATITITGVGCIGSFADEE